MKNNKFFGKKSALYALVVTTAALGMASVNTPAQAAGTFDPAMQVAKLKIITINNHTNGCVRAYAAGQHIDIPAHRSGSITAGSSSSYMASVFKYGCGGQALGNRWYTANNNTLQTWNIY